MIITFSSTSASKVKTIPKSAAMYKASKRFICEDHIHECEIKRGEQFALYFSNSRHFLFYIDQDGSIYKFEISSHKKAQIVREHKALTPVKAYAKPEKVKAAPSPASKRKNATDHELEALKLRKENLKKETAMLREAVRLKDAAMKFTTSLSDYTKRSGYIAPALTRTLLLDLHRLLVTSIRQASVYSTAEKAQEFIKLATDLEKKYGVNLERDPVKELQRLEFLSDRSGPRTVH